jgi:hypothetical protein
MMEIKMNQQYRKRIVDDIEECYLFRKESHESDRIMRGIDLNTCTIGKLIALRAELVALPDIDPMSFATFD